MLNHGNRNSHTLTRAPQQMIREIKLQSDHKCVNLFKFDTNAKLKSEQPKKNKQK